MAAHTDWLRGTEGCADMAALASYVRMGAVEHKPGAEMIKGLLRSCDEAIHRSDE